MAAGVLSVGGPYATSKLVTIGNERGAIPETMRHRSDVSPLSAVPAQAAWCGQPTEADRTPNAVAGNPVHWVYLIPSDGTDNLGAVGSVMQSDAEQIDAWWRAQDPTRTPRNDVAGFSCGAQLDITTVRSGRPGSDLMPLAGRFASIVDSIEQADLTSAFTKYVVYYDGPVAENNICGQGASDPSGFGVAVVFYRACSGVSTAGVAVHEFLHTIGAVARGAPNECTGEASGHVCDDDRDLMYPSIGAGPLSAKLLDSGRNDYYGHFGGWTDTQDSAWLVRLDAQVPFALTISGPGSVSADVPGLQCDVNCTTTWNSGQRLSFRATPATGARLVRWGGNCSGAAGCVVSIGAGTTVSALFAPASFRLNVSVAGRGAIRSSAPGIACRPRCSASFPSFTPVRLTAMPAQGWRFRSWTGACKGSRKTCVVPMSAAANARATFSRV
jgi:Divergent InlB B-repeat domain